MFVGKGEGIGRLTQLALNTIKHIVFVGDSLDELRKFPDKARRKSGAELLKVQREEEPANWKPMSTVGKGVRELRIRDKTNAYRLIYVLIIADTVHVLHAFQKKTQETSKSDIDLARQRLKDAIRSKREKGSHDGR